MNELDHLLENVKQYKQKFIESEHFTQCSITEKGIESPKGSFYSKNDPHTPNKNQTDSAPSSNLSMATKLTSPSPFCPALSISPKSQVNQSIFVFPEIESSPIYPKKSARELTFPETEKQTSLTTRSMPFINYSPFYAPFYAHVSSSNPQFAIEPTQNALMNFPHSTQMKFQHDI